MNTNLIISIVISLMVGGAVGAGATRLIQPTPAPAPTPACAPAPAPQTQVPNSFNAPPLTDQGKTYR